MEWTKETWEKAMEYVMTGNFLDLLTEIPPDGAFRTSTSTRPKGPTFTEVQGIVPQGGSVVKPSGVTSEIPPDGGFRVTPAAHHPDPKGLVEEIPNHGPAVGGPRTPLDWAALNALLDALGKMPGTGDPVHYAGPNEGKNRFLTNPSITTTDDGTHGEHLSMSDGSYFIQNLGDLLTKIDQVKSLDSITPNPGAHYQEIKNHIARRAQHIVPDTWKTLIPDNWNISFDQLKAAEDDKKKKNLPPWLKKGDDDKDDKDDKKDDDKDDKKKKDSLDAYLARTFSEGERKDLAKKGTALPDGSYPVENMSDLHNAIQAFGRGKGDKSTLRAHILSRAKALGAGPDLIDHIQHLGIS